MMLQIEQMRAASKKASQGEVSAVFKVSLELFVTVGYEKGELDGLTDERLRASLVEQANGMIGLIETADAIEIGEIIEVRDLSTDEAIEVDGVGQKVCKKCDSPMHGDYCSDDTCPYSEWPQNIPLRELLRDPAEVLRERYGVQLRLRVDAEVHSDDRRVEVDFDAAPWFAQASDDDIRFLQADGWGFSETADVVALHFGDSHPRIGFLFEYLDTFSEGDSIGFECHVDPDSAMAWLKVNRPDLWSSLRVTQE